MSLNEPDFKSLRDRLVTSVVVMQMLGDEQKEKAEAIFKSWAQEEKNENDRYRLEQRRIDIEHIDIENANLLEFALAVRNLTEELAESEIKVKLSEVLE